MRRDLLNRGEESSVPEFPAHHGKVKAVYVRQIEKL